MYKLSSHFIESCLILVPHSQIEIIWSDNKDQSALSSNEMLNSFSDVSHSDYQCI